MQFGKDQIENIHQQVNQRLTDFNVQEAAHDDDKGFMVLTRKRGRWKNEREVQIDVEDSE